MAGISNPAFRVICKEFGAGLIYTEMVSDKALYYDNEKTVGMTDVEEQEHPLAMQIFGHDIETMVYAAKFLDEKTDCDITVSYTHLDVYKRQYQDSQRAWSVYDGGIVFHLCKACYTDIMGKCSW